MEHQQMLQMIAADTKVKPHQADAVIKLLEDGNTVPFIARYRKEATGSLDEVQIKAIEPFVRFSNKEAGVLINTVPTRTKSKSAKIFTIWRENLPRKRPASSGI